MKLNFKDFTLTSTHIKIVSFACILGLVTLITLFGLKEKLGLIIWDEFKIASVSLALNNEDAIFALEIGNYYFNVYGDGVYDLDRAKEYFEIALIRDPNVPDAWHQLARIDFLKGDFFTALSKINKQIDIHGDSFMASYYIRGLIYGYMKEYENAEQDFLTFLTWDEENWAANNDLAWVYFSKGDYEKTLLAAKKGLDVYPSNPWVLNMYGLSLINLNRHKEAISILENALEQAKKLTVADWHKAYPGNHPSVAEAGLVEMVKSIEFNLELAVSK